MAITNPTTASSRPLARTDTPQIPAQQQAVPIQQPPKLHVVEPLTTASMLSTDASSVTITEAPQLQAGVSHGSPRSRLRAAAGDGDGKVVKHLLANEKPDVNAADPATGMTALMLAASAGHDDVVFLLTKGMQPQD